MEKLRSYTLDSYIKLGLSSEEASGLEEQTYKTIPAIQSPGQDIDKYVDKYIQSYIKVITNYNNAIKNKIPIKDIITASRETLDPEKWNSLSKDRKNEGVVIDKKKGIHRCPKCKSWYTDYQQLQTASADESMRVSVVCLDCDWHWKYS